VGVVWDMQFHKFVQTSETVPKTGVLNALLVRYNKIVERLEARNRVDNKMSVTRDLAHWIVKQSDVHDRWQGSEGV